MAGARALPEVHDVAESFGAVAAVQGVSVPLYPGEAHAGQITGEEGEQFTAGKLGEYTIAEHGEIVLDRSDF